ncbi:MAG: UDP-3-O-(3-hydroxymyristoyl)glucosamine N-acyltransferase [Alphaproteobacteria bacterium]
MFTLNNRFFHKKFEFLTLDEVLKISHGVASKSSDLNSKIFDIKSLPNATENDLSFLSSGQYQDKFLASKAGFCFIEEKNASKIPTSMLGVVVKNPYFAYAQIVSHFYEIKPTDFASQYIHPTAKIGNNSQIAPNVVIGSNVEIGNNAQINAGAVIADNVKIGDNCIIGANSVISFAVIGDNCIFLNGVKIGQEGFGFVHNNGVNHKILQIGIVQIGNNVEIGANSCIDRGALENTIIHDEVKIDNLCQIAHNVEIGKGTVMAGSSGVAGSCKIGKYVQIGGNSSIAGHIKIGDGVKIAGMSGVMRDIEPMAIMAGIPVLPIKKWHRLNLILQKLLEKN